MWSDAVLNQPQKSMGPYEAELHQAHKRFALPDASALDRNPILRHFSFVNRSRTTTQVDPVPATDRELSYTETKLGCARGVLWAVAFQVGLIIAIAASWKFI